MSFDVRRIGDPLFFAENRMRPHSDHRWFADQAEAASGRSRFEQSLNGLWKFHYAKNPSLAVAGFEAPDYDCADWDDIPVPAHIQFQGYDRPQYTNVQYPWDGWEPVRPGQVPTRYNPVASYVKVFRLDRPLAAGERLSVAFHGAESALAVWLNGVYIGYGGDSFTPSEFDLTAALAPGENKLAVQVFRWSGGSWIEDQDFYRFSGLFRDVVLYRRPAAHAEDVRLTTWVADDLSQAEVRLRVAASGPVQATLEGVGELAPAGQADGAEAVLAIEVANPALWSSERPHLYDLSLRVLDQAGALSEHIGLKVGIRRFGIEDGLLKINGQRLVFKGVNRHEFGLRGRVMTRDETEADIRIMKAAGINAVRTSHYPNNSFFYDLCDQYGLYVIDEMNLEAHGMWDHARRFGLSLDEVVPGDRPEWLPALLDRAAAMVERDKNHPCVVMWSCGNESLGGRDILRVSEYFREVDSRPVHYEGVYWDPRYPETTDVVSRMYAPAQEVEEYLATHRSKPYIMCEYGHAMGNSFGAVHKYLELAYREPLFQGGFVWDFADQVIQRTDRYGQGYFGYGGDTGDAPNDLDFSGNGVWFADRSPTPKTQELKHLYQPIEISVGQGGVSVANRHLFTGTEVYDCRASLARDGQRLAERRLDIAVGPGLSQTYPLPFDLPSAPGEYAVEISFQLRAATAWAQAGHEVAFGQGVFARQGPAGLSWALGGPAEAAPELVEGIHNFGVRGRHFMALFSRIHGGLVSYRFGLTPDGGRELLQGIPRPNFWHAPTSNELGWQMPLRDGQWLLASRYAKIRDDLPGCGQNGADPAAANPAARALADRVEIRYALELGGVPPSQCDMVYSVFGDGRVELELRLRPGQGLADPPEFGALLTASADLRRLRWYGDGPAETYVDRRRGARLGIYQADVARQLTGYLRPQEAGNHTGVRWAEVTDGQGNGLRFDCAGQAGGMEFSALPWTPWEIENAAHPVELPPIQHTVLRPALMRRGVGGDDSWGAEPHPEYRLPSGRELTFRFGFQGLRG